MKASVGFFCASGWICSVPECGTSGTWCNIGGSVMTPSQSYRVPQRDTQPHIPAVIHLSNSPLAFFPPAFLSSSFLLSRSQDKRDVCPSLFSLSPLSPSVIKLSSQSPQPAVARNYLQRKLLTRDIIYSDDSQVDQSRTACFKAHSATRPITAGGPGRSSPRYRTELRTRTLPSVGGTGSASPCLPAAENAH